MLQEDIIFGGYLGTTTAGLMFSGYGGEHSGLNEFGNGMERLGLKLEII